MDINERLYRYRRALYILTKDYNLLINIYSKLINNRDYIYKFIRVNNDMYLFDDYYKILQLINVNISYLRSSINSVSIMYNRLLEEMNS